MCICTKYLQLPKQVSSFLDIAASFVKSKIEEPHQEEIRLHWDTLRTGMEPWPVVTELFTKGVISYTEKEDIKAERTSHQQAERLLDILITKDGEAYLEFVEALRTTGQELSGRETCWLVLYKQQWSFFIISFY